MLLVDTAFAVAADLALLADAGDTRLTAANGATTSDATSSTTVLVNGLDFEVVEIAITPPRAMSHNKSTRQVHKPQNLMLG